MSSKPKKSVSPATRPAKPARPVRRRLAPEERRVQIVAAARALFAEGGLPLVTMRNIARRVGITQAAIYQHFADKDEILGSIAEAFFEQMIVEIERGTGVESDPVRAFRRSIRAYIEVGLANREEYRLVFMTSVPGLYKHAPEALKAPCGPSGAQPPSKGQIAYGTLQTKVHELLAGGHIRGGDAEVLAKAIWAAEHGIVSLLITHDEFLWEPDRLIDTQIDMLLNGLLPDDSPAR
jgi:AcrR family transcriptional regulator